NDGAEGLNDLEIATVPVDLGRSSIAGRSLAQIDLKGRYGITILAIRRQGRTMTRMTDEERIRQDDLLYVLGTTESISRLDRELH
ncbi:MAG: TrkA C-terminal domain-containing protein, partial [Flavobacteriales bacterium]|nr:TrkA C-terminal domain-containing protein [Flavobacteriales bacterium]